MSGECECVRHAKSSPRDPKRHGAQFFSAFSSWRNQVPSSFSVTGRKHAPQRRSMHTTAMARRSHWTPPRIHDKQALRPPAHAPFPSHAVRSADSPAPGTRVIVRVAREKWVPRRTALYHLRVGAGACVGLRKVWEKNYCCTCQCCSFACTLSQRGRPQFGFFFGRATMRRNIWYREDE